MICGRSLRLQLVLRLFIVCFQTVRPDYHWADFSQDTPLQPLRREPGFCLNGNADGAKVGFGDPLEHSHHAVKGVPLGDNCTGIEADLFADFPELGGDGGNQKTKRQRSDLAQIQKNIDVAAGVRVILKLAQMFKDFIESHVADAQGANEPRRKTQRAAGLADEFSGTKKKATLGVMWPFCRPLDNFGVL